MKTTSRSAFTLVEMLVVIGIIAVLTGSLIIGMGNMRKTAMKQRSQEIVSNAATALNIILEKEMGWPKLLLNNAGGGAGRLDENVSKVFVTHGLMGLLKDPNSETIKLAGADRFGVVDAFAADYLKTHKNAEVSAAVPVGGTIADHRIYYAIDEDGDGITEYKSGKGTVKVRANAVAWICGYGTDIGYGKDADAGVYSWSKGQVVK